MNKCSSFCRVKIRKSGEAVAKPRVDLLGAILYEWYKLKQSENALVSDLLLIDMGLFYLSLLSVLFETVIIVQSYRYNVFENMKNF